MKKGKFLKGAVIIGLVAVATIGILAFTYRSNRTTRALPVDIHTVAVEDLLETVSGTGTFVPETSSMVYARISGVVEKVYAATGDKKAEGAPLLELETADLLRAVRQAESSLASTRRAVVQSITSLRAAYRNASTAREQAQRNLEKNRELLKIQAISEEAFNQSKDVLDQASVNFHSAREQLNLRLGLSPDADPDRSRITDTAVTDNAPEVLQAEIALETARSNLAGARITAPASGTVTQFSPAKGDFISPNSPIARIESLDAMRADVNIDEVDIGKIAVGSTVEITSDSILGVTLSGIVTNVAPVISQVGSTRVSLVKIRIDGAGYDLKAGASCTARITTRTRENVPAIPLTGFITRNNISYAYVLHPDNGSGKPGSGNELYSLEERKIETGISTISRIEIRSGLAEGEVIATGDLDVLRDGMRVTRKVPKTGSGRQ